MGPPLAELYDQLRARGFTIGVDDHVRIGRLVARDGAWTIATLKIAIAALVMTDARDRAAFDAAWTAWIGSAPASPPGERAAIAPAEVSPRIVRRVAVGVVLALAIAGAIAWLARPAPHAPMVAIRAPIDAAPRRDARPIDATAVVGVDGGGVLDAAGAPTAPREVSSTIDPTDVVRDGGIPLDAGVPIDAPVVAAPVVAPPTTEPATPSSLGPIVAAFTAIVGAMLAAFAIVLALHAARRRKRFLPGPWRYRATIPATTRPILGNLAIEDTASALTFQAEAVGTELDLPRTIDRTLAAGGLLAPVYQRPHAAPVYVVLEDTARGSERWRFLYDELLRGLVREGVELVRYTFDGVPETCGSPEGRAVALRDVVEHADALIAIGDGRAGIDPATDAPAEWVALLRQVPRRIWINPLPEPSWSAGARAIARDTPMEHGVARGVARLRGSLAATAPARAFPAIALHAPGSRNGFAALRTALDEPAFHLLCGVALAGQPSIAALLWLGEQLGIALDETAWLRLATLPWIADGAWPDGVRDRLIAAASVDLARRVAPLADRLLAASEPDPKSAAHLAWQLDVADRLAARGDRAGAAIVASRVTASPLAPAARKQLAALGLRDRRARALAAYAALGAALLVLGLDPLERTPAIAPRRTHAATAGVEVAALDATHARVHLPLAASALPSGSRLDDDSGGDDLAFAFARDDRPLELVVVEQIDDDADSHAQVATFIKRLPKSIHMRFVGFAEVVATSQPGQLPDPDELRRATRVPAHAIALRAAVDRGLRLAAAAPATSRRRVLVIATGRDDAIGPSAHVLAARAAQLGIPIDAAATVDGAGAFVLGELARTSGGTLWIRPDLADVSGTLEGATLAVDVDIATLPQTLVLVRPKQPPARFDLPSVRGLAASSAWTGARLALRVVAIAFAALAALDLLAFAWLVMRRRVR